MKYQRWSESVMKVNLLEIFNKYEVKNQNRGSNKHFRCRNAVPVATVNTFSSQWQRPQLFRKQSQCRHSSAISHLDLSYTKHHILGSYQGTPLFMHKPCLTLTSLSRPSTVHPSPPFTKIIVAPFLFTRPSCPGFIFIFFSRLARLRSSIAPWACPIN